MPRGAFDDEPPFDSLGGHIGLELFLIYFVIQLLIDGWPLCEHWQLLDLAVGTLERLRIVGPNGAAKPSSTDHTNQRLKEFIGRQVT